MKYFEMHLIFIKNHIYYVIYFNGIRIYEYETEDITVFIIHNKNITLS